MSSDRVTARLNARALKERAGDIDALTRILHRDSNLAATDEDVATMCRLLRELGWHDNAIAGAIASDRSICDTAQHALDILSIDIIRPATLKTDLRHIFDQLVHSSPICASALRDGLFGKVFARLADLRVRDDAATDEEWFALFEILDLLVEVNRHVRGGSDSSPILPSPKQP